jgi:hypothetical protein
MFKNKNPSIESDSFDWAKNLRYYYKEMEAYELEE